MKVILLCAGYATRLYPLTKNQPKPLLPVGGKPMLEHILERLRGVKGIEKVFVVSNHFFAGHFERWNQSANYPWPIEIVDDQTTSNETRLGAIGDLHFVLSKKKIGNEDLLVIAGDNLFTFDLVRFVQEVSKRRPYSAIAVYDVKDFQLAKRYGLVKPDKQGQVLEFFEKPENPTTTLASCGLYWLPAESRVLLDRYLRESDNPDQPGHYMRWLSQADRLFAIPLEGSWYDIGDLASYEEANARFVENSK